MFDSTGSCLRKIHAGKTGGRSICKGGVSILAWRQLKMEREYGQEPRNLKDSICDKCQCDDMWSEIGKLIGKLWGGN